MVKTARNRQR